MKYLTWPLAIIELVLLIPEIIFTSLGGFLAVIRVRAHRDYSYKEWLKRDLADCETVLELGCGRNSPLLQIGYGRRTIAVDIFKPYVELHNRNGDYCACTEADILDMPFPENTFDAVVMCDVLEHLPADKVNKIDLLGQMQKCAIKKVIIFTPNGFVPNDEVDGDPYQAHVSAWEPEYYIKRGFKVRGATGLRWLFGKASLPKYHPYSVCSILGMLSQSIVYHRPEWAWHSYCVKDIWLNK